MEPVQIIAPDLVLVDWGPMTLTISAWRGGEPITVVAAQAARHALQVLAQCADFKKYMRTKAVSLPVNRPLPPVVARALDAAMLRPRELTPLAAVAGAAADEIAIHAFQLGADKVIVNNGGDIAVRLGPGQKALVGIGPREIPVEPSPPLLGRLRLDHENRVQGVATSGWDGRSLSPGVADLVTVWAERASLADAAATWIASRAKVESPAVERVPASQLEPASDLGDRLVTKSVGRLSVTERLTALDRARQAAAGLMVEKKIKGCIIAVQGELAFVDPMAVLEVFPVANHL